jgi:hypothetical protein
MKRLDYLTDALHACGADNANVKDFAEPTAIIRGRDAVKEFLACGICPLSNNWDFAVETKEDPLSKVIVPKLQVTAVIGEKETLAAFEARVVAAANVLVGNYIPIGHKSCMTQLRHGWLNRVFELVGVTCWPRAEPLARKCRGAAEAAQALSPWAVGRKKLKKALSRSRDTISEQEEVVTKLPKSSRSLVPVRVVFNLLGWVLVRKA